MIRRVFQVVSQRPDSFCNYCEGSIPEWGENIKLIYRHYATLYFVFAVDSQESDLGILDLIQGGFGVTVLVVQSPSTLVLPYSHSFVHISLC